MLGFLALWAGGGIYRLSTTVILRDVMILGSMKASGVDASLLVIEVQVGFSGEKEKQECTALIVTISENAAPSWKMYVDDSVSWSKSGQRIILICPNGYRYKYALKFLCRALNNATEYEALIESLQLARDIGVSRLEEFDDSQLVVNQTLTLSLADQTDELLATGEA
ncbi:hypothetical protein ACLB2K_004422 [Fragaria x ananassa]